MTSLFHLPDGRGALVIGEIEWFATPDPQLVFAKACGKKDNDSVSVSSIYANQCIGGVYYTEALCVAGATFNTYQLPGVTGARVEACHRKLKQDRDVVGKIRNHRITELIKFDCPFVKTKD